MIWRTELNLNFGGMTKGDAVIVMACAAGTVGRCPQTLITTLISRTLFNCFLRLAQQGAKVSQLDGLVCLAD